MILITVYPNVEKAGALQRQGAKGEAVAIYCDPLATQTLECSGFPERVGNMRKIASRSCRRKTFSQLMDTGSIVKAAVLLDSRDLVESYV